MVSDNSVSSYFDSNEINKDNTIIFNFLDFILYTTISRKPLQVPMSNLKGIDISYKATYANAQISFSQNMATHEAADKHDSKGKPKKLL